MKKSLLSVSQLTKDNNVVTEFNSTSCLIKDKDLGLVLLQETLKDGLYQLVLAFGHVVSESKAIPSFKTSEVVAAFPVSSNKCTR